VPGVVESNHTSVKSGGGKKKEKGRRSMYPRGEADTAETSSNSTARGEAKSAPPAHPRPPEKRAAPGRRKKFELRKEVLCAKVKKKENIAKRARSHPLAQKRKDHPCRGTVSNQERLSPWQITGGGALKKTTPSACEERKSTVLSLRQKKKPLRNAGGERGGELREQGLASPRKKGGWSDFVSGEKNIKGGEGRFGILGEVDVRKRRADLAVAKSVGAKGDESFGL